MPEFVTEEELARMVIAASHGEPFAPSSPYAEQVWQRIRRQVAEIQARGAIVDLSSPMP